MDLDRRKFLVGTGTVALTATPSLAMKRSGTKLPNIICIVADDLGYADLGCYGAHAQVTPAIDSLARDGLRLTQAYAASCVCSPSRIGLITGRYPGRIRAGLDEPIVNGKTVGLPPSHPTLPSLLREQGYRTSLIGKWHMGDGPAFGPLKSGYDKFFGIFAGGTDYFEHKLTVNGITLGELYENATPVERAGYITDLLGERALADVRAAAAETRPFFMSLHFTAPHWPWEGPEDGPRAGTISDPRDPTGGSLTTYAAMVASMDRNIGRLLDELKKLGLEDDTIVIFTSDNGGERYSETWPLVGMKGELLEGGIRVPFIIRWPNRIAARNVSHQVFSQLDLMPTLLSLVSKEAAPGYPPDGANMCHIFDDPSRTVSRELYWRHKALDQIAVRHGDWKYLRIFGNEYLFNLENDVRERADKRNVRRDIFSDLRDLAVKWNDKMIPYPSDSYSEIIEYSDRY